VAALRTGWIGIIVLLRSLGIASTSLAACWQLTPHGLAASSGLMALAVVALAGAALALVIRSGFLAGLRAGPLVRRAVALRRKSWGAAFQRQRDPDAAGHARPRAPSAAPAAA
jgi:hypothetical protein